MVAPLRTHSQEDSKEREERNAFFKGVMITPEPLSDFQSTFSSLVVPIYGSRNNKGLVLLVENEFGNPNFSVKGWDWRELRERGLAAIVDAQRQQLSAFDGYETNVIYYGTPVRLSRTNR